MKNAIQYGQSDNINTDKEELLKGACRVGGRMKRVDGEAHVRARHEALVKWKGLMQRQLKGGNDGHAEEKRLQK